MNLVTSPHKIFHHPSLPSLVTVPRALEKAVAEDEAFETDLVKSWSKSTKHLCLSSRVFAKGFAVVSRVLQINFAERTDPE